MSPPRVRLWHNGPVSLEGPAAPYRSCMPDDSPQPSHPGAGAFLLRVSGADRPGITADLMTLLELAGSTVQDVEQVLVRGHLTLAVAIDAPAEGPDPIRDLLE